MMFLLYIYLVHKQMAKEILVNISFCVVIGAFTTKKNSGNLGSQD
jgi:hypothetical protein